MTLTCKKPDRDFPKLICGYPLPCPHHTVIIDPPMLILPESKTPAELIKKLKIIMEAMT